MSHFSTLVFIQGDTPDEAIAMRVENLLAPFDENLEVEPYEEACGCVSRLAIYESWHSANALIGSIKDLQESFTPSPGGTQDTWEREWQEYTAEWRAAQNKAYEEHPMKDKPDPDCPDCFGGGVIHSTSNPDAKWDWWEIGGRWNGAIPMNAQPVRALGEFKPFAIVTPYGGWHESGNMGWFGVASDTKDDWSEIVDGLYKQYEDCLAVLIDAHI